MDKIIYCQFSNELINGKHTSSLSSEYYNAIYKHKEIDGYYKDSNFFELPLWIAEISGSINNRFDEELYIIENIKNAIEYLSKENAIICFSVLEVNKTYIKDIAMNLTQTIYLGGYIDFSYFDGLSNIKVFKTVKDFILSLGIDYEYNLNYSLFRGYKTIPRLTLSSGCLNTCKFCSVEKTITEKSEIDILKQVNSFIDLDFKLIYINDKTLGQANNYNILIDLYGIIKSYNSDFKGFIVQTTVINVLELQTLINTGIIFAIEIGIESFNDNILYSLYKPQTEMNIINAMEFLKDRVKIIGNIIIGLPMENIETYNKTLNFIRQYKEDFYILNIYNLAIYENSLLSKEFENLKENDYNENIAVKSYHTENNITDNEYFYNNIFSLAMEIL